MTESQAQNHLMQHWFVDHVMHNPVIIGGVWGGPGGGTAPPDQSQSILSDL